MSTVPQKPQFVPPKRPPSGAANQVSVAIGKPVNVVKNTKYGPEERVSDYLGKPTQYANTSTPKPKPNVIGSTICPPYSSQPVSPSQVRPVASPIDPNSIIQPKTPTYYKKQNPNAGKKSPTRAKAKPTRAKAKPTRAKAKPTRKCSKSKK